ncbi:MAG: Uma2 family endonuclease [Myxococcota bacterium]|nr:Uma2 family endonuclease [Myxococcota bacterium]
MVEGRLEFLGGRLWYMPPSGDIQQFVAVDVAYVLRSWVEGHPEFRVGGNEAGILFGKGEIRAADVAVWRRDDSQPLTGGFQTSPPVLAVEVAGREDEGEEKLREKALWYLARGVEVVWLIFPETRSCLVIRRESEESVSSVGVLSEVDRLPGLTPRVASFFSQLPPLVR